MDYFHILNIAFVIILLIRFLLLLLLLQLSFCYYIVQTIPLPFIKGSRGWTLSKLMAMGDLKNCARKGGLVSLEMGGFHIISRFFWRFFTMLHRKKSWCHCTKNHIFHVFGTRKYRLFVSFQHTRKHDIFLARILMHTLAILETLILCENDSKNYITSCAWRSIKNYFTLSPIFLKTFFCILVEFSLDEMIRKFLTDHNIDFWAKI